MSKFTDFCAGYFNQYFALHPTEAIYYGVGGYDHLLNQDEAIDYSLLKGRLTIQRYEHAKEDYRLKWPDTYSPIDAIYILTVRATNDFVGNLFSRLEGTPALIRQGITNL